MASKNQAVPDGYNTITAQLAIDGAAEAIEFYKKAFGAVELMRIPGPDGRGVMHAEMKIGDSIVFLSDEFPQANYRSPHSLGGRTGSLYLYVDDVDAAYRRAIEAGAKASMPVTDMFWGDRFGSVMDPFGHSWGLATRKENVSAEEMVARSREFHKQASA